MPILIALILIGMEYQNQKGNECRFCEKLKMKNKPKFVGVRQRASGKWAAEIKDTSKKIRLWLGTYETAEEAARAYDEAACLLRGSNTLTNFSTQGYAIPTNSPISLKLRKLLDRKAMSKQSQIQNQSSMISSTFQGTATSPSPNVSAINKIMVMEDNSACSSEGESLFLVRNHQVSHNPYELDMNMNLINCSMGITPNTLQFDYSWPLAQQRINELSIPKNGFGLNVERQLSDSDSVYNVTNECHVEDTYENDVNYPLSQFFCFT